MINSKAVWLQVGKYGLSHGGNSDRQFMIITEKERRMITGRVYPRIVLISAKVADDKTTLTLSAPDIEDLTVNIPNEVDNKINTKVKRKYFWHCFRLLLDKVFYYINLQYSHLFPRNINNRYLAVNAMDMTWAIV